MKKAAKRSALRPICAVLAVLFCFCASLLFDLYVMQVRYGGDFDDPEERARVFLPLLDRYADELTDAFQLYYRTEGRDYADCPDDLLPQHTNLRLIARDDATNGLLLRTVREMPDTTDALLHETLLLPVTYTTGDYYLSQQQAHVRVEFYLPQTFSVHDSFYMAQLLMRAGETMQPYFWTGGVLTGACTLLFAVLFLCSAWREGALGRTRRRLFRELSPDLVFICLLPLLLLCIAAIRQRDAKVLLQTWCRDEPTPQFFLLPAACAGILFAVLLWFGVLLFSLRRYGLRGTLTFLRYENAAFTRKTLPATALLKNLQSFLLLAYAGVYPRAAFVCILLEKAVTMPVLYRCLREIRTIAENTEALASGDLSREIGSARMVKSLKDHADDIQSVAKRISVSADEYIRSGRFKAELITNLSHDIKTPLTSIINYAALLQDDTLSAQDRARYIGVLHRHAQRLSRLVEDLTQVSDTQSGRIEAHKTQLDLTDLVLRSAMGFEERLQKQNITLQFSVPETPVQVLADQRLLWRVADNLMNNICKYSAPGTTVQISVMQTADGGTAEYQNVPATPPEKTADALMERFVRADGSRHTEGNGLGLSIARSLMQLQDGTLTLRTTPELFSATISVPKKGGSV